MAPAIREIRLPGIIQPSSCPSAGHADARLHYPSSPTRPPRLASAACHDRRPRFPAWVAPPATTYRTPPALTCFQPQCHACTGCGHHTILQQCHSNIVYRHLPYAQHRPDGTVPAVSIWVEMPARRPQRREGIDEAPPSRLSVLPRLRHPWPHPGTRVRKSGAMVPGGRSALAMQQWPRSRPEYVSVKATKTSRRQPHIY